MQKILAKNPENIWIFVSENLKNNDFTHLVFPIFSSLTVRIGHFRPQNRIPHEKLHIYTSGHVWTPQI